MTTTKARIVEFLGERSLTLPAALDQAIRANERAKYVLSLLQMAASHADNPTAPAASLREEREACGIADRALDRVTAESESDGRGNYAIPEAKRLGEILLEGLEAMLAPLALAPCAAAGDAAAKAYAARLDRLRPSIAALSGEITAAETISSLTSGSPRSGDGVHLLVMDLHRELNDLIAKIAEETIEGAHVYAIAAEDRPLVAAFAAAVNRTAPLKFDHPGLATTAMRSGDRLLIQNDIGETTTHVIVIAITGLALSLTYSDAHLPRLRFFQAMLANTGIVWDEVQSRQSASLAEDELFYTTVGRIRAAGEQQLCMFLAQMGSRIVFLIDWNKARKRLGLMVPNAQAIELLSWAAEQEFGHRAFLQLGGERLIYDALEDAVRTPLRYGEPLQEMLGPEVARDFLRFVLEATATGLREGHSAMLINDRIRVELFNHLRSAEQRLLADAVRHASLIVDLARGLEAVMKSGAKSLEGRAAANAQRAKALETQADDIVKSIRATVQRITGTTIFGRILEVSDDAADSLEDASFLAGLLISVPAPDGLPPALVELAALVTAGSEAFRRFLELAPGMHRGATHEAIDRFLAAVEELISIEHRTDDKEREMLTALLGASADSRGLFVLARIGGHLEAAADALLQAGLMLRDHVMGEIMFARA